NFAGYLSFDIQAEEGQKLVLRFGELLDEYGELTQENIQCNKGKKKTPLQQVVYRAKAGENKYKTRFAIFGFQYVEIDTDIALLAENFTGIAVYSGFTQTGRFRSSNQLLNRFVQAAIWSAKSNSADLPTDCPTRERHGWTGDAQIFFESASYLFDYASFAKKYLRDVYDWQKKSGKLPQIAPMGGVDFYMNVMNGSAGWSDIGILLPYHFWKLFGDEQILEDYYDGMRAYAGFLMRRCGKWGGPYAKPLHLSGREKRFVVNTGQSYGEWAEPADVSVLHWYDFARPHPEVSTAYTAYMMDLMEQIAVQLGKTEDIAGYHRYKEGCREAYRELVKTKAYSLDTDRQARLVRPLAFGLLDKEQEKFAKKRLLQALENYGWRLGTGFLSTPLILDVLMEIDPEAAYRLLENEEIPGWLSMPKAGATTIWESWEGPHAAAGVGSLNHYSKGAICRWLFASMCGIKPAGENAFLISPQPGGHVMFAEASYYSVYGMVSSGWERKEDGKLEYRISIPANTTAAIILPDGREYHYGAGNYQL
ncbi:MAG TPA: family 78 glycoside hydrolase catalytic domain, partial [Lachnospiraceae bacterium]|nr:family 78 glycoside hydrolase catalytic domain [Lachnospiraceae bacterium]